MNGDEPQDPPATPDAAPDQPTGPPVWMVSTMDQMGAMLVDFASPISAYYTALRMRDVSEVAAIQLTMGFQSYYLSTHFN